MWRRANTLKSANDGGAFIPLVSAPRAVSDLPCPSCGSSLAFVEAYQRWYCHRCLQYAPEGYGDRGAQACPTCGGILSYVRQYGRMYCYHCNAYPPEPAAAPTPVQPASAAPAASAIPPTSPEPAEIAAAKEEPPLASPSPIAAATPEPSPEPPKAEETKPDTPMPESPASGPQPMPVAAVPASPAPSPAGVPAQPEAAAPSPEMRTLAAQKPAAVRVKLFALKKSELVDLCRVYGIDSSGSKESLQDRLLDHLHELESINEAAGDAGDAKETDAPPAASAPLVSAEPVKEPEPEPASAPVARAAAPLLIQEEKPEPGTVQATDPAPAVAVTAPAVPETPRAAPKVEHPCPTCGRELAYIAQYNRHYCYYCQRYAPAGPRAKNACPTCGSTMRWIDQHRRWWCDDCQRYASADLPAPSAAAQPAATMTVIKTVPGHRHGSPAGGAGLVGFGLALYIVYAFFGFLGNLLGFVRPAGITTQMLDALQFLAFLLLAVGAIVGLYGVRHRE